MSSTATHLASGKVRELYSLDGARLLLVASDRISTFDVVLPTEIPDKGRVLTGLSGFWFSLLHAIVPHHMIAIREDARSMECRKLAMLPIECVVRGYLAGSGWKEYQESQTVCGVALPPGLRQCDKLPQPIFTPATKEESGHDINIDFPLAVSHVGIETATQLRDRTLALYTKAADYARSRGIIIADTKFEFGKLPGGRLILIDEILTPDSSRFWPADKYSPGRDQESFDKQFVRNWLERQPWDKTPPAPRLPDDVVAGTRARYIEAYEKLTGRIWS